MMKTKEDISPKENEKLACILQNVLGDTAQQIQTTDYMRQKIESRILEEKENENMKRFSVKKVVVGVIAASLLVGTVVVAANGIKYIKGQSPATPQYTDFSDKEKAEAEAGMKIDGKEKFDNGAEMSGITVGEEVMVDEAGKEVEKKKTIRMEYKLGDDTISYSTNNLMEGQTAESYMSAPGIDEEFEYQGKKIVYKEMRYRCVTPDYVITEEDQKAMDEGELDMGCDSIGGVDIPSYSMQWMHGEKACFLLGMDLKMSPEEARDSLLEIAEEIIDIQLSE